MRRVVTTTVVAVALAGLASAAPPAARPTAAQPAPRVTLIGDSVMTAVLWYAAPLSIMEQDIDLRMEVAVCRTLEGESCPDNGVRPPTLLDLVATLGPALGQTVIVVVGYNDPPDTFPQAVEDSIEALLRAGVTRILWANLTEARPLYPAMNQELVDAARSHPELTVLDWDGYSRNHPEWFQNDGIHLLPEGGIAMATFLHDALMRVLQLPLTVAPTPLPVGFVGQPYTARLVATGGTPPYRWTVSAERLPHGLRLHANGIISGVTTSAGRATVVVTVEDAKRATARRRELLVVRRLGRRNAPSRPPGRR
jgi:Putative Ig domain